MVKSGGEIVHQEDIYPDRSVECVLLFSENPATAEAAEKYTIHGIIRMQGYRSLTVNEKILTYTDKLAAVIDTMRSELHAPLFGFINSDEAEQIFRGVLENAVSLALRSTKRGNVHIVDIFFQNGDITVIPLQDPSALTEG